MMRDEKQHHGHTHTHHDHEKGHYQHSHREHHIHEGEGGGHRRGGGHGGGHFGGPRDRARRGEARYVLLDALRDSPKHGYEIIKTLEEKSGGQYSPSPGTVYPTMQFLEDQGLVRADQESERRVYHLTDAGRADLETHKDDLAAFWARFASPAVSDSKRPEIGFLQEEMENLTRTVWSGLRDMGETPLETIRRVREAVQNCRNTVREIIAASPREETF